MKIHKINHIGIAGAGAWGTALAQLAAAAKLQVTVWANTPQLADDINRLHENPRFLPGQALLPSIQATVDARALEAADAVLMVCPAQTLRHSLRQFRLRGPVVICAKGIEQATGLLMHEVCRDEAPAATFGMLSGPSFAADVVRGLPCAVTIAFEDAGTASTLCEALGSSSFRPYASTDVTGVAIGGAVKNVLAIAAGLADGLGCGHNARAALVTRGLAEISRLAVAMGGRRETLMGLAGLGDLVLTCTGDASRNRQVGLGLARGRPLAAILEGLGHVAEGVQAARAARTLAHEHRVELPITEAVASVLDGAVAPRDAVDALLRREPRSEG